MSWDDIEINASDICGGINETPIMHPVQMIMSADRVIEVHPSLDAVKCPHPRRPHYETLPNVAPVIINEYTHVPLGVYLIRNVPVLEQLNFDAWGRVPLRCVYWRMGLCMCGTLFWAPVTTEYYTAVKPT